MSHCQFFISPPPILLALVFGPLFFPERLNYLFYFSLQTWPWMFIDDAVTVLRVILDYIGIDADDMVTVFFTIQFHRSYCQKYFQV